RIDVPVRDDDGVANIAQDIPGALPTLERSSARHDCDIHPLSTHQIPQFFLEGHGAARESERSLSVAKRSDEILRHAPVSNPTNSDHTVPSHWPAAPRLFDPIRGASPHVPCAAARLRAAGAREQSNARVVPP